MAQHTPGPWKYAETFANNAPSTWNVYAKPEPGSKRFNGECVAVCETPANAALIAAAPDMYEAITMAMEILTDSWDEVQLTAGDDQAYHVLNAALARAEGR